jgi:hypothetical protein
LNSSHSKEVAFGAAFETAGGEAGRGTEGGAGALAADLEPEPIDPIPGILAKEDILEAKVLNVLNSKPINFFFIIFVHFTKRMATL